MADKHEGHFSRPCGGRSGTAVVPLRERYAMSVEEAAEYFGLGQKKIRRLAEDNPHAGFGLHNGNRLMIKRKAFEAFLDELDSV